MVTRIELPRLRELLNSSAQLVEVLPNEEYADLHLPGAVSIPLKLLTSDTAKPLRKEQPVVVYCWDYL